jgi:hypothetical protein
VSLDVALCGEGCALILRVLGYERPNELSGADANWLSAEAVLHASSKGVFEARQELALRTEELLRFRDQAVQLLQTLSGEAVLTHMEEEVGCTIRLKAGVGELDAWLREPTGIELRVTGARTDQSYLQQSLRELQAVVDAFPIRGAAIG